MATLQKRRAARLPVRCRALREDDPVLRRAQRGPSASALCSTWIRRGARRRHAWWAAAARFRCSYVHKLCRGGRRANARNCGSRLPGFR
eukprot:3048919-Prymnesium_polylepis.2